MKLKDIIIKDTLIGNAQLMKKKRVSPGFDGMSASGAVSWITINGNRLCRDILDGDYSPMPAIEFNSAKASGGYRILSKLSVIDMIIQNTLCQALTPFFDAMFSDSSFAYQKGKGVSAAAERCLYLAEKNKFVVKLDFVSCFDNISHEKMKKILDRYLCDKKLIDLIYTYLKIPVSRDGELFIREKGLVQGAPLSPLLCNLYFHIGDCYMEDNDIQFVRYADDIVLFCESYEDASDKLKMITDFFDRELELENNLRKSKICSSAELDFLGFKFKRTRKGIVVSETGNDKNADCYYNWNTKKQQNNRRKINILSDGILRQKEFSILFDTDSTDTVIPPAGTDIINVYSNVIFDTNFFAVAAKNGITVNLFNQFGERIGSFVPDEHIKAPSVLHTQLMEYYDESSRLYLAKEFVLASVHNSILNIRYYNKQNDDKSLVDALNRLTEGKKKIKAADSMEKLLLLEARARQVYYECFDLFSKKEDFRFEKCTRRPPKNKFNSLLQFGNAVLYNYIAHEIQKTALDIRVGFLHATTTRAKTLNLDIAEIFKPLLVDRTVLSLINKGALSDDDFITLDSGAVLLNAKGKDIFLNGFCNKLETQITVKGENMKYTQVITDEIRKLVRHFRNNEKYKAFRQVR